MKHTQLLSISCFNKKKTNLKKEILTDEHEKDEWHSGADSLHSEIRQE